MSRSRPNETAVNPCSRWYEWSSENGLVRYYDRDKKENVDVGEKFTFIMLDELFAVKGFHKASKSGITSNEVRNTKEESMTVRSFKGGPIAEGLYQANREDIKAAGGRFVSSIYLAYKNDKELAIGNLQLKGAALNAWVEFKKKNRAELYKSAISINGKEKGQNGTVVFFSPTFALLPATDETNLQAAALDGVLQEFLDTYMARPKTETAKPNSYEQLVGERDSAAEEFESREVEEEDVF